MTITYCKDCHGCIFNFAGDPPHKCPPAFLVWYEGHGDDPEEDHDTVYTHDAEAAAENWAERHEAAACEYSILGGSDETVKVRPRDGGPWVTWVVSGETVAHYSARRQA